MTKVLAALSGAGLLLEQSKDVLNVVTLITGETLRTSWWSHPKARLIFAVLSELSGHPDVLFTKLLYGKVTLVHRQLWPAFLAVATEEGPSQLRGLSVPARRLLASVHESKSPVRCKGATVKELELRLLVHAHGNPQRVWTTRDRGSVVVGLGTACRDQEFAFHACRKATDRGGGKSDWR